MEDRIAEPETLRELLYDEEPAETVWKSIKKVLDKEKAVVRATKWVKDNPRRREEYRRQYYLKNKDDIKAASRLYIKNNPEKVKLAHRAFYENRYQEVMLREAEKRAKKFGLAFSITAQDIVVPAVCPALGIELKVGVGRPDAGSPSLDRIIPSLGYTKENICVISHRANRIKNDATLAELELITEFVRRETHVRFASVSNGGVKPTA